MWVGGGGTGGEAPQRRVTIQDLPDVLWVAQAARGPGAMQGKVKRVHTLFYPDLPSG